LRLVVKIHVILNKKHLVFCSNFVDKGYVARAVFKAANQMLDGGHAKLGTYQR